MSDKWIEAIDRYGVSLVALAVLVWLAVKGIRTFWGDLVIPLRDRLIGRIVAFFDKLDQTLDQTLVRDKEAEADRRRHEELAFRTHTLVEELVDRCERIEGLLTSRALRRRTAGPPGSTTQTPPGPAPPTGQAS